MNDRRSRLPMLGLALVLALGTASVLPSGAQGAPPDRAAPAAEESRHTIHLKSRTFVPKPGLERAAIVGNRAASDKVHFIAQFSPLPTSTDRAGFARAGIRLQAALGGGAYVATSTSGGLGQLKSLPGFRWAGPLKAADKIDPAIRNGRAPQHATTRAGKVALTIQVHADRSVADAAAIARSHGGTVISRVALIPSVTAIFSSAGAAQGLAAEDGVLYVSALDAPLQDHNDGARVALNATPVYTAPYGLTGAGSTVLVWDSGTADVNHPDFAGRVAQTDADASANTRSHSTHVAGTVLGDGANSTGNDSAGNPNPGTTANQYAGIAPGARLATFASLGSNGSTDVLYDDAGDIQNDFTTAIGGGVDLATMSQGNNTGANGFPCGQLGDYTNTSILIDQIVAGSISNQELIWFQSAGNERNQACAPANGFSTISSPANAKNSIVIGAINSNDNSMTNFSSWGPSDDGRLRPDMVGPGCQSGGDGGITSTDFLDDGDGNLEAGETTNAYSVMCGTSMATPAVAGVGALVVEQWRATYGAGTRPLPHSMKALLAHTATDLGNAGPDYSFGYGQVNAQAAIDLVRAGNLIQVNEVDQGVTDTWYFTSDGAAAPRITLAWTDPAATRTSTTQLVNDLNLVVTRPGGGTHLPQVLTPGTPNSNSAEGTDSLNVMEMVLGTAEAGTWKVEVRGTTIPTGPSDYTLVTPTVATENAPPVADAGGPYTTDEGASVQLDGTGSSDPEGGPLTYAWDLDNNGSFETAGATPTFPAKGQDGVYTVVLRVTDDQGSVATDTSTVTVNNVAPTVTVNAITAINEHGTTTISGTITDPGWLDPITATIDFDDGNGPVALAGTIENDEPVATFTFSVNKQYGDNGTFVVTVTGYDDDTSASDTENAVVANVNPTATIDSSGEQVYDGVSAFVLQKGQSLTIPGSSTDPGSDDLTFRWIWGDGSPDSTQISRVNPPADDPAKSPSVQPRDVSLSSTHAYLDACLFELGFSVTDDDTGSASDSAVVLVTGNATVSRGHGWWLNQYRAKSPNDFTPEQLQCYLDIVNYLSMVFSESTTADTRASATKVLNAPAKAPDRVIFDQHALGAWLNFANGSVKLNTLVDADGNGSKETTFGAVMFTAETIRLNPASTSAQVKAQKNIIERIATQSG